MNCLVVSGNIGKDAVVRKAGEQSVAGFSLAMKSGYGEKAQTIWLDCSLWGKQAESGLVQYLKKGQFVVLSGELGTREHEGKTYLTLRVNDVTLGGKSEQSNQQPQQQPQRQAQQQAMPAWGVNATNTTATQQPMQQQMQPQQYDNYGRPIQQMPQQRSQQRSQLEQQLPEFHDDIPF